MPRLNEVFKFLKMHYWKIRIVFQYCTNLWSLSERFFSDFRIINWVNSDIEVLWLKMEEFNSMVLYFCSLFYIWHLFPEFFDWSCLLNSSPRRTPRNPRSQGPVAAALGVRPRRRSGPRGRVETSWTTPSFLTKKLTPSSRKRFVVLFVFNVFWRVLGHYTQSGHYVQ